MDVILRQHVANVGKAGDIVQVKDGYARNFLLPRGLAFPATEANRKRVEAEARARGQKLIARRADAEALAAKLSAAELHCTAKVGEGDRLFGSITSADIAAQLAAAGFTVDKRDIDLDEPIKAIGVYKVPIRLHPEVRVEIRVWVVRD